MYHTRKVRETVLFLFPASTGLARRPLLLMLAGLVAGILLGRSGLPYNISAGILLALTTVAILVVPKRPLLAALIPLSALAGAHLISPWTDAPPVLSPSPQPLTGRIEGIEIKGNDLRCTLRDVGFADEPGLSPPHSGIRLIIKGGGALPAAEGMRLTATCRLRPFTNFNNPGRFDYREHMAHKGIAAWAVVKASDITLLPASSVYGWKTTLYHARRNIEQALFTHAPTARSGALLAALITGNRSHISPPLRDLFTQTGTAHLLAISGLHLGMVTTLFFFLFRHLLSFWERPLIKGHTQVLTAAATLVPVLLYALLSGVAPSTQRALIAASLFLGALTLHEEADLPTTLALAALVILGIHPPALFAVSFQLSFAAVAAILASLVQLRRKPMINGPPSIQQRILTFIIPPSFASFGTAPLVWYHFGYAAPVGLLANLVLVPIVSFAVVLPGLLGVLILPIAPPLAGLLFLLAGCAGEAAIGIATFFSTLPGGFLTLPRPGLATTLLVLLLLFSLLLSPAGRQRGPVGVALLCLLLLGGTAVKGIKERHHNTSLQVTVLDVGHGSATVVAFPGGKRWLIDGGFAWPGGYDVGQFAVAPYLQTSQITTLDAVVLTHPESDHMGGLLHILKRFTVHTLITSPHAGNGELWDRFCETASQCGPQRILLTSQSSPMLVEGVRVTCLHPSVAPSQFTGKGSVNNNSLVLLLEYGGHRILLTGDIMKQAESRLVAEAKEALQADVILIPHHGSTSSSTPEFLARVHPSIAVVSAGQNNRYGLPHDKVMARYTKAGCALYRTDRHGAVTIESDGVSLSVSTFLTPSVPFSSSFPPARP
ncbi:DNA internalization-related competence protein ComEC/Rec2 [Desulfoluna limicola]|uniref:DNA internalization-related competence protein ComEC/Rec2 n=1 Tax=Desulfoluna limicola TaxID=2810562 RepID=A0ABM7PMT1_9BACT|nr:DNA internalization-related competence protein ComEC/Rec2 [Desulfoluna limicola]BCS98565.1 DNA internalization-related competence protein ComEC/Rec2 [Desulfoluna limicola]